MGEREKSGKAETAKTNKRARKRENVRKHQYVIECGLCRPQDISVGVKTKELPST